MKGWCAKACLVAGLLFGLGPSVGHGGERELGSHDDVTFSLPADYDCAEVAPVIVRSPDSEHFAGQRVELQRQLGGVRAALKFECPEIDTVEITGKSQGDVLFEGRASQAGGWRLEAEITPGSETTAQAEARPEVETTSESERVVENETAASNAIEFLEQRGNHGIFLEAAEISGFADWIREGRQVQLFAPTDGAMEHSSREIVELIQNDREAAHVFVAQHHTDVITDSIKGMVEGGKVRTGWEQVSVDRQGEQTIVSHAAMAGHASVLEQDHHAGPNLVHIIDRPLTADAQFLRPYDHRLLAGETSRMEFEGAALSIMLPDSARTERIPSSASFSELLEETIEASHSEAIVLPVVGDYVVARNLAPRIIVEMWDFSHIPGAEHLIEKYRELGGDTDLDDDAIVERIQEEQGWLYPVYDAIVYTRVYVDGDKLFRFQVTAPEYHWQNISSHHLKQIVKSFRRIY